MYNRYVPQPDGSYRKNRMPEQGAPPTGYRPSQRETASPPPLPPVAPPPQQEPRPSMPCQQNNMAGDFLRRLLPKNLDTGDLMVILLLLLMAGDSADDKNNALLTLALYLFM